MAALATALALAVAGCGGDDEGKDTTAAKPPAKVPAKTETASRGERPDTAPAKPPRTGTSPEDQPGGAGDEQPARAPAELTGRGGRITPARVQVPAFISVLVRLRSGDGGTYGLRVGAKTLKVGPGRAVASTTVPGLHAGKRLTLTPTRGGSPVVIEANAEPGP